MREVTIGVRYAGWRNSKCMPRPTKRIFSIEPPQDEPSILTRTGSGQNDGWPDIRPLPATMHHRIPAMLVWICTSLAPEDRRESSAFNLRLDDIVIHFIIEIRMTAEKMRGGVHPSAP